MTCSLRSTAAIGLRVLPERIEIHAERELLDRMDRIQNVAQ
jgi:hypothetical protein